MRRTHKLAATLVIIFSITAITFSQRATAAPKMVHDPMNLAELILQGEQAANQSIELLGTLGGITDSLAHVKKTIQNVYKGTQTIVRSGQQLKNIYETGQTLNQNIQRNLKAYRDLADAGWLTTSQLNYALTQTNYIAARSYSLIANAVDFCANLKSFQPKDALDFLSEIEMKLIALTAMNNNLFTAIDNAARKAKDNMETKVTTEKMLTGEDYRKIISEQNPYNVNYEVGLDGSLKMLDLKERPGKNQPWTGSNDPEEVKKKIEEASKEVTAYVNTLRSPAYNLVTIIFLLIGICTASYSGYKMINGQNEGKNLLMYIGIGFIIFSILMSVLKLTLPA